MPGMMKRTMRDRCEIRRPELAPDRYDQLRPTGDYTLIAKGLRCRLIRRRRWVYRSDTAQGAWVMEYKLVLPPGYDVQKDDVVIVGGMEYRVEEAVPRGDHHLTLELRAHA